MTARVLGKGKQDASGSTSIGNRIGVTVYWARDPQLLLGGSEGTDQGTVATASTTLRENLAWRDIETEWTAAPDHAGRSLVVKAWYEHHEGTADAYGYFDGISLVRKGGMQIKKR